MAKRFCTGPVRINFILVLRNFLIKYVYYYKTEYYSLLTFVYINFLLKGSVDFDEI